MGSEGVVLSFYPLSSKRVLCLVWALVLTGQAVDRATAQVAAAAAASRVDGALADAGGPSPSEGLPNAPVPPDAVPASQAETAQRATSERDDSLELRRVPRRLLSDEWHIVSSPARIQAHDLRWLVPVAAVTAAALATDTYTMQHVVSQNATFHNTSDTVSGALRDAFIGVPVVLFGMGEATHRNHETEAGLLAGEAMINAYVTDEGIKYITLRERPALQNARGHFWTGDSASDPSFVSGHSIVAWSAAAVLAGEYSKPWQQAGIYTLASGVSLTRVMAYQHFPSDAVLGAVSGWLIGRYVLHAHRRESGR